jgi:hypothetical protein
MRQCLLSVVDVTRRREEGLKWNSRTVSVVSQNRMATADYVHSVPI